MKNVLIFVKKIFKRIKNDSFKQFISRIGLHLIIIYPKIKRMIYLKLLRNKFKNNRFIVKEINESKMYLDIKDNGISAELLFKGIREPFSTEFFKNEIKKGDICVDIGANIGYYALLESRLVGDKGKVYAIEPVPENIKLLKRNIEINQYSNIDIFQLAIGDRNDSGFIYLFNGSNLHSMNKNISFESKHSLPVKIITLDKFLEDKPYPNIIRMDTEGYEEEIIKGMEKTLSVQKPLKIFIEFHCCLLTDGGVSLLKKLKLAGFKVKAFFNEPSSLILGENKLLRTVHDIFQNGLGSLDNRSKSYNVDIDYIIQGIKFLKGNFFEVFFERD